MRAPYHGQPVYPHARRRRPLAAALKNQLDAIEAGMEVLLTLELGEIEARLQRRLDARWREIERQAR